MEERPMSQRHSVVLSLACAGGAVLLGCAARQPPTAKLATADTAVREAIESEAAQYAPLELRLAREKLERARRAGEEEEYDRARRLAEQAFADAELAKAKTRAEKAQQRTEELRRTVEALRSESERGIHDTPSAGVGAAPEGRPSR
jgi:hypothetical protein